MKLYKGILKSGQFDHSTQIAYVVAKDYGDAENALWAQDNFWEWRAFRRIACIEEIKEPVMLSDVIQEIMNEGDDNA